jgi:hypothetical protein
MRDYWRRKPCPICNGRGKLVAAIIDSDLHVQDWPAEPPKTVEYHEEIKDCHRCNGIGYFMISRYVPLSALPEDLR